MMVLLYLHIFAVFCRLGAAQVSPICTDTSDGKVCSIKSEPFILKVFGKTVLIGVNNSMEVYDVLNLEHSSIVTTASEERINDCRYDLGFSRRLCHNFVFGIEEYSEHELAVCGSNAYWPQCRLHRRDILENSRILFSRDANDAGYSAFGRAGPTPATFIASNGHFFTVAQFATFGGQELLLRMAPNYRQRNLTFVVTTPWNALEFFHSPTVIFSIHEVEDRIYIYYTERDAVLVPSAVTSRVARVCKNDLGMKPRTSDFSMLATFRTFEKARIICQSPVSSSTYDIMLGTSVDAELDGTPVVYATFNASLDGAPGGIICKISFNSSQVDEVFADRNFVVQTTHKSFSTEIADYPVNCPGSGQPQRSEHEARRFILHRSVVIAEPIISQQVVFLDKIVSEIIRHQVAAQEIIFFTNVYGDIRQLVRSSGISHIHTIYAAQAEQQVRHLVLHKYNGSRILIAATEGQIMQFNRGRCYCYVNCHTCLASKDPYCGWSTSIRACISKLAYTNEEIIETYSASTEDIVNICGVQEIHSPEYSCPLRPFHIVVPVNATPVSKSTIQSQAPTQVVISANCIDTSDGKTCDIKSEPYILRVFGNTVYVGVNNSIEVYDVLNLEHSSIDTNASERRIDECRNNLGFSRRLCQNFVSGIEEYSESELAVCGSNAYWPKCRLHRREMLGDSSVLFSREANDAGYSTFGLADPTPATFIANNGYFFTVAQFARFGGHDLVLRMAPNYRQRNLTFVVTTPWNSLEFFHSPSTIFSIHEVGDRIYIYYTERALEAVQIPAVYSRVARVCKNDLGMEPRIPDFSMLATFRTFEKARIICQPPGSSFTYDNMLGTSINAELDGTPVVYATFNAPLNGPPGGIICKISFTSSRVDTVFADRNFMVQTSDESFSTEIADYPVNCSGSGPQRSEDEARRFILHRSVVIAEPLISLQACMVLDKIVSEVIGHQDAAQEIIFFTNVFGDIKQLVRSGSISHDHTIYTAQDEQQVRHLVLHKHIGSRILIAATEGQIMQFNRGRCYCYIDCYTCLASKDPYCGWSTSRRACISKLAYNNDQINEAYSASTQDIANICGMQEKRSPVYSCPLQPFHSFVPQRIVETTAVSMTTIQSQAPTPIIFPACADTSDGKTCGIKGEPYILRVFGNTVYIGVNNSIEVYDVLDLEHSSIRTIPSQGRINNCIHDIGFSRTLCHNFVFGIEEFSENELIVCGSNAYWPQCRLHRRDTKVSLSSRERNNAGYSAFGPAGPTPATYIASNGYFFTVAQFATFGGRDLVLRMAPNYRQRNLTFAVTTPWNALEFFHSPSAIFSIHEVEDRIYIYYTERDAVLIPPVVYSRVARVCKNDLGMEPRTPDFSMLATFRTFEKARIICQSPVSSSTYDIMLGTSVDAELDGTPVVYATFNAPLDGAPGGIICKISFNSSRVDRVFADRNFMVQTTDKSFSTEIADYPVNCPGSGRPQRSEHEARRFILHHSVVVAEPLISVEDMFLEKIVSEIIRHQVAAQEIIFFTNMYGDIRQLVRSSGISHIHTIYAAQAEQQVRHLVLHKYNGSRILIAATEGQIMQFNRGRCYCYVNCHTCLASKDPYCGWSTSIRACISKLAYTNEEIIETYSASTEDIVNICGVQEMRSPEYSCPLRPFHIVVPVNATPASKSTIQSQAPTQVVIPSNCIDTTDGKSCGIKSEPYILRVFGNTVYVGVNNSIEVYDVLNLEHSSIDTNASERRIDECRNNLGFSRRLCQNFVSGIEEYSESELAVCGSNAYWPKCRLHRREMLGDSSVLFSREANDAGYSAFGLADPTPTTFIANNGYFFTVAQFARFGGRDLVLRMAPNYRQRNLTFVVTTPWNSLEFFHSPSTIFSIHEVGDRIYIYYTERALEAVQIPAVYSRVARVCKNDLGMEPRIPDFSMLATFRTFEKARIICQPPGSSFTYDNMLGTSINAEVDGTPVVYATFNAPLNGPPGGIICKISFSSSQVDRVFADRNFMVQTSGESFSTEIADYPVNCSGSGPQRSEDEARKFILHRSVVIAEPLISLQACTLLDKIVSEIVGHQEEIIFFTNVHGDIRQLVRFGGISHIHTIYAAPVKVQVRHLVLHKYNGSRILIAATEGRIMQFNRGRCYCYVDCYTCLASKDPYCGWSTRLNACFSKLAYFKLQFIETYSASTQDIANICGVQEKRSPVYSCPLQPFHTIVRQRMDNATAVSESTLQSPAALGYTDSTHESSNLSAESSDDKIIAALSAVIGIVITLLLLTVGVLIIKKSRTTRTEYEKKSRCDDLSSSSPLESEEFMS